jgi:hypothetical protein
MAAGYRTASGRTIIQTGLAFSRRVGQALGAEMYLEGEGIMAQSKELVPVDTGALRASGYVELPVIDGLGASVELGYGGPASRPNPKTGEETDVYAIIVHEDLEAHHKVGIAKYLEIPFLQAQRGMASRIRAGVMTRIRTNDATMPQPAEPTSGAANSDPTSEA